ncbi:hypothetical protein JB92DRAFT_1514320 [Gautieria morchelliformis]|nr:hypothetical protein JB92DRAFT_1514320 [Gautieria morchelliformis]
MRESGRWIDLHSDVDLVLWRLHCYPLTPVYLCCGSWALYRYLRCCSPSFFQTRRTCAATLFSLISCRRISCVRQSGSSRTFMAFPKTDQTWGVAIIIDAVINCMRFIVLTATLNLVIHLWFEMRAAFSHAQAWTTKLRTFTR